MMSGFVAVWLTCPRCRAWFDAPKWQPLAWDQPPQAPDDRRRSDTADLFTEASRGIDKWRWFVEAHLQPEQ